MTPEQLEEIPGIGEKTLEKISVAVRNYFGRFEEGEGAPAPEDAENESIDAEYAEAGAAETPADVSVETAVTESGEAEIENAPAVVAGAEAEAENAAQVLEEAESVQAAQAEDENRAGAEAEAEADTEAEGLTAAEVAIESVPVAEDGETLDSELDETESATPDEQAAKEDGA
jgi:N utilization substance protein A